MANVFLNVALLNIEMLLMNVSVMMDIGKIHMENADPSIVLKEHIGMPLCRIAFTIVAHLKSSLMEPVSVNLDIKKIIFMENVCLTVILLRLE